MGLIQLANDDFTRADNVDLGASWDVIGTLNSLSIVSNAVRAPALNTVRQEAYVGTTFPVDHWSEVTVKTAAAATYYVGPFVRYSAVADTGYIVLMRSGGTASLNRVVAGVYTEIGSHANTVAAGDVIRLEARGSRLYAYHNGVLIITATDTTHASGLIGFRIYNSSAVGNCEVESWRGGCFSKSQGTGRRRR
jgi:hypothetical protein